MILIKPKLTAALAAIAALRLLEKFLTTTPTSG